MGYLLDDTKVKLSTFALNDNMSELHVCQLVMNPKWVISSKSFSICISVSVFTLKRPCFSGSRKQKKHKISNDYIKYWTKNLFGKSRSHTWTQHLSHFILLYTEKMCSLCSLCLDLRFTQLWNHCRKQLLPLSSDEAFTVCLYFRLQLSSDISVDISVWHLLAAFRPVD